MKHPTFWAVFIVYAGTYSAANSISTYCENKKTDNTTYKLAGTTVTNMILGISKDKYFAREFSKVKSPSMPITSLGLFFVRDLLTIGAGFTFPSIMRDFLLERGIISNKVVADTISQILVPVLAQSILTPLHLLALDIYNRRGVDAISRAEKLGHLYFEAASLRMVRVMGAYGIAGISNTSLRKKFRHYIDTY